ncbi:MAG: PilW family protein [Patescibacteria group bacterium]
MKRGFTLIELLIYIVLAVFILNVGVFLVWQILQSKAKLISYHQVINESRFILEKISFEARRAKLVEIPKNQGEESQDLLLRMPDNSSVYFYLEKGNLILERRDINGKIVSSFPISSEKIRINELSFKNLSPKPSRPATFQVKMKINYYNPSQRGEYRAEISVQQSINLRDNSTL